MSEPKSPSDTSYGAVEPIPDKQDLFSSLEITTKGSSSKGDTSDRITPARTAAAGFLRSLILKNPCMELEELTKGDDEDQADAIHKNDTERLQKAPTYDEEVHGLTTVDRENNNHAYQDAYDYNYGHAPPHYYPYNPRGRYSFPPRRPPPPHSMGQYPIPSRTGSFPYWADHNDPRHEAWAEEHHAPECTPKEDAEVRERRISEESLAAREYYAQPPPYFYHPPYDYRDPYYWNGPGAVPAEYGEHFHHPRSMPPYPPPLRNIRYPEVPHKGSGLQEENEHIQPYPSSPRKGIAHRYSYPYGPPGPPAYAARASPGGRENILQHPGQHPVSPPSRHQPMPFGFRSGPLVAAAPRRMTQKLDETSFTDREIYDHQKQPITARSKSEKEKKQDISSSPSRVYCTCRKSKCLKLYCQCFSSKLICLPNSCRCVECKNTDDSHKERKEAIDVILARNPSAFETKISDSNMHINVVPSSSSSEEVIDPRNYGAISVQGGGKNATVMGQLGHHKVGCKCRKSACLKKYCECYNAKVRCTNNCRCVGCQNNVPRGGGGDGMDFYTGYSATVESHALHSVPSYERYPSSAFSPTKAKAIPGFAISQLKTRPGGAHAQVVDAAQHLAFLKNDSTPSKAKQTRYPSPTTTTNQSSIITHSIGHSNIGEKRLDEHKLNTPEKRQLSIPVLSSKSSPNKHYYKPYIAEPGQRLPNKNSTPLLMAAMAMTELLGGGQTSPPAQPDGDINSVQQNDSNEANEPLLKKVKVNFENNKGGPGGEQLSAEVHRYKDLKSEAKNAPTIKIASFGEGQDKLDVLNNNSAFKKVGDVGGVKPSDEPLIRGKNLEGLPSVSSDRNRRLKTTDAQLIDNERYFAC